MSALSVLQEVEEFLRKDLAGEVLSVKGKSKRSNLLTKVSESIFKIKEENKLEQFLAKQREYSRAQSSENGKKELSDDEDDGDHYMDLTEISSAVLESHNLSPPAISPDDYGSGSGYESYASDEDISAKAKSNKEDLSAYFSPTDYEVFTYIYIENKNKFLKGKKWLKRIGVVKENHLKFYKKPNDSVAVLDVPLRGYNTTLRKKEGTTWIAVILSTVSSGEAYRFHVERNEIEEWTKVLREITLSLTDDANLPPPVAARPPNTLPRLPTEARNDRTKSLGDISIVVPDTSPPPVPPGHPSLPQQNQSNISKGIKMAVSDMFKKDKTKKKIMTAENLGADVCGHLMVFDNKWIKKWCLISQNQLMIYGKEEAPELQIELQGCDLLPHRDDKERPFRFKILRGGKEVVYLEASSSSELGKWVGTLIAETGCAELPEEEPDYLPMEIRKNVMTTTKQAFDKRKDTIQKKSGRSTFFQESQEEENIYLDLDAASQYPKQSQTPQKIVSPPLPPSSGRQSKSHSIPSGISLHMENGKSVAGAQKTSPTDGEKTEEILNSELKKAKGKQRKKEKNVRRHMTEPDIKTPINLRDRDIKVIREPLSLEDPGDDVSDSDGNKTVFQNIIEKRKREYMTQKADLKTKILTMRVKKDELNKYIEGASTEKERERLRKMQQKATDDLAKLEKDDAHIETELKNLKEKAKIESPANKRPPPRKPINTGVSGNVMSKAQMWEAASKK